MGNRPSDQCLPIYSPRSDGGRTSLPNLVGSHRSGFWDRFFFGRALCHSAGTGNNPEHISGPTFPTPSSRSPLPSPFRFQPLLNVASARRVPRSAPPRPFSSSSSSWSLSSVWSRGSAGGKTAPHSSLPVPAARLRGSSRLPQHLLLLRTRGPALPGLARARPPAEPPTPSRGRAGQTGRPRPGRSTTVDERRGTPSSFGCS